MNCWGSNELANCFSGLIFIAAELQGLFALFAGDLQSTDKRCKALTTCRNEDKPFFKHCVLPAIDLSMECRITPYGLIKIY